MTFGTAPDGTAAHDAASATTVALAWIVWRPAGLSECQVVKDIRILSITFPDFAAQFTTPMFIPATYCIQDGPTDVQVTTVTFNEEYNWANVTVEGAYKGGWMKMWDFTVVPVEGDD